MIVDKIALKKRLSHSLLGWPAQRHMSPAQDPRYRVLTSDYKTAAVMALIYHSELDGHKLILIERAKNNPKDKHAGQIGLPGGKYEDQDGDLLTCALREVHEEIGVAPQDIEVLGSLSQLFVFASNFLVYPYVGFISGTPDYQLQVTEVDSVLEVRLSTIMDAATKKVTDIDGPNGMISAVPYYDIGGRVLWGATAMIVSELEQIILAK